MKKRRTKITEQSGKHKKWKDEADAIKTPEELATFVHHLTDDYIHDYGTICHAISAACRAAYHVVNASPQGGITGFQASCIGWDMVNLFMGKCEGGRRIVKFENLLYPQCHSQFTQVSQETADWLIKEAKRRLEDNKTAPPEVLGHWKAIAEGNLPFGFTIEKDSD